MGTHQTYRDKKPVDQDKKLAANYLKYEENMPEHRIRTQLQIAESTFDKMILPTRDAWLEFRAEALKNGRVM